MANYSIDFYLLLIVTSVEVLQASVYGIGVCAEFGGAAFKPLVGGGQLNFKGSIYIICKVVTIKTVSSTGYVVGGASHKYLHNIFLSWKDLYLNF